MCECSVPQTAIAPLRCAKKAKQVLFNPFSLLSLSQNAVSPRLRVEISVADARCYYINRCIVQKHAMAAMRIDKGITMTFR
jgi:hypothetical protein